MVRIGPITSRPLTVSTPCTTALRSKRIIMTSIPATIHFQAIAGHIIANTALATIRPFGRPDIALDTTLTGLLSERTGSPPRAVLIAMGAWGRTMGGFIRGPGIGTATTIVPAARTTSRIA